MNKTHFSALRMKHAQLEGMLATESQRPLPDAKRLADIKKQKLRLKDVLVSQ